MKNVLIAVAVIIVIILAVNCYLADQKVKQSARDIDVLNGLIKEKDAAIDKLMAEVDTKTKESEALKKELEGVKTDLSNTVLKLQSQTQTSAAPAPVRVPVRK